MSILARRDPAQVPASATGHGQPLAEWRLASVIPVPASAPDRDLADDIEAVADLLRDVFAPFARAMKSKAQERKPVWCPVGCHTDLRQLTVAQQEEHWDKHSYWAKRQAKKRARW